MLDDYGFFHLPPLEQSIKEIYGVDAKNKKPLDIQELSKVSVEKPSLLLCAMLSSQPKAVYLVKCLIEVLAVSLESTYIW